MSKVTHGRNTKVRWLPAVANIAAPSVAEIAAGTDLTPQIPSDGLQFNHTRNNASVSMLDDDFVPEDVGTYGTGITLKFVRDDTDDDAFDLFNHGEEGFLLISRFGAPAATKKVEVYPASSHEPAPLPTAENEYQQFEVQIAVTRKPNIRAVVAA